MTQEETKREGNGRFQKGVSGNRNGRPKTKKPLDQTKLNEIYLEAAGDPIRFQELVLQNGHHLALDLNTALRLAKELAPYREAKKASVEVKQDTTKTFMFIDPTKAHLENIVNKELLDVTEE